MAIYNKIMTFAAVVMSLAVADTMFAQTKTKPREIEGKITKVVVFPTQALIEKTTKIHLTSGDNNLILVGNSPFMIEPSLQFETDNDVMVTDFTPSIRYVEHKNESDWYSPDVYRHIKSLRASIDSLEYLSAASKYRAEELRKEKDALNNMKAISNSQSIDSLPKIQDALTYYRPKITEINDLIQSEGKIYAALQDSIAKFKAALNVVTSDAIKALPDDRQAIVTMNLYSEKECDITLTYNYNTTDAGWTPLYDVKVSDPSKPVKFVLKAQISQSTSEDWNGVSLIVSSETPNTNMELGELSPYYLLPLRKTGNINRLTGSSVKELAVMTAGVQDETTSEETVLMYQEAEPTEFEIVEETPTDAAFKYTSMTATATTMLGKEYSVGTKHTILSGDKPKTIPLETKTAMSAYKHYAVPKLSGSVFLSADIAAWEDLDIIASEASIYSDNRFVGNTYLSQTSTDDTLSLPIGQDNRVSTERKVVRSKPDKSSMLSSDLSVNVEVTLSVRNANSYSVNLNLEDQIPVSQSKDIVVKPLDIASAEYDKGTGKLKWALTLAKGETKTIKFSYSVRYPKEAKLNLN
ncbi:MAG: DUF4139 domain-containing protein [Bacteroidales bacterium]|jgi:uncharacterized protein (TIGR02231 family)|nr:DUF4139 domain-containing protein [Bacteroidales bacterium]